MRRSPLLHPLAILRTTIGLTQKELGDLVHRAARTIQSIELCKMPLTQELALRIAEATGVDEAWLFAGNPETPPPRGMTLLQAGRDPGEFTKADYEFYRAFVETAVWSEEGWARTKAKAKAQGNLEAVLELGLRKVEVMERQQQFIQLIDEELKTRLALLLVKSVPTDDMRLVRWKLRRFLNDLAKEFSLEIPQGHISIETLKLTAPTAPLPPKVINAISRRGSKTKT